MKAKCKVTEEMWDQWAKFSELQDKILVFKDCSASREYGLYVIDRIRDPEKGIVDLARVDRSEISFIVQRLEELRSDLADEFRKMVKRKYKAGVMGVYWQKKEVVPLVSLYNLEATSFLAPEDVKTIREGEVKDVDVKPATT